MHRARDFQSAGPFSFQATRSTGQRTSRCQHEELRREHRLDDPHATPSSCFPREASRWHSRPGTHVWSHARWTDSVPHCGTCRKGSAMNSPDPIIPHDERLDAQATAFAQLLGLTPNDMDAAYRRAIVLGDGLFPHQIEGVAFLLGRRRAILADDMGLGKTRQAIVALRHASPGGPYLVVCPASVKRNWAREIVLAAPGSSVRVVEGGAAL